MKVKIKESLKMLGLACMFLMLSIFPAQAVTITGGSSLLDMSTAGQLQTWLGEGEITINNIFSYTTGDALTAADFHAAADGLGRTFSVFSITSTNYTTPIVFGGYNPQSWHSGGAYNITIADADRTAWLFNFGDDLKWDQKLSTDLGGDRGRYQTYNHSYYGPTFGGGHDIADYTQYALGFNYNYPWSYGPYPDVQGEHAGITGLSLNQTNGPPWNTALEVFTISEGAPVPEPATMLLLGTGLIGLAGFRRKFKEKR
jgi:hypothetical protein